MKRQKVLFLKKNYVFRILKNFIMAGLFAIALLLILIHKIDLGVISGISKGVFYLTSPIIRLAVLPAEGISYAYKKASEIADIYQENERLKQKNDELYLLKDKMRALKTENMLLKKLLHHIDLPEIESKTAYIIAETGNAFANSLILYLGNDAKNIKPGYAVVSNSGLIGRIDIISGKYARVMLITDINSKIPVVTEKNRDRGILIGNNTKEMKLLYTPLLAELQPGDLLVTSGIGGGIPANIPIARIKNIEMDSITATPLFNTQKLEMVKIIIYDITPTTDDMKELE